MGYYDDIKLAFEGQTTELKQIPKDRLDWGGSGVVLEIYDKTSGRDRDNFVHALGEIIQDATLPPPVVAQALHIAASLDIAQVEPSVNKLSGDAAATVEPIKSAIANYRAFRSLRTRGRP